LAYVDERQQLPECTCFAALQRMPIMHPSAYSDTFLPTLFSKKV